MQNCRDPVKRGVASHEGVHDGAVLLDGLLATRPESPPQRAAHRPRRVGRGSLHDLDPREARRPGEGLYRLDVRLVPVPEVAVEVSAGMELEETLSRDARNSQR